ncbi:MAG: hypothetical protein IPP19_01870 [Verrucomicrobia bacterium]|nr:hypothetical protein [Verrucomicrobiota bacterium]
MKLRFLLLTVAVFAIGAICFFLGQKSAAAGQSSAGKINTISATGPRAKPAEQSNRNPPSNTLSPGVVRKPSSFYITHKGPSYSVHMLLMTDQLKGFHLSAEQIQKLQDVYSAIYEARLNYEVSIAKVGVISDRESLIEIPSFEAFGQQLKQASYSMFEDVLGVKMAKEVLGQLELRMEGWNEYWGKHPQSILVNYDPSTKLYRITRTVYLGPTGRAFSDGISDVAHLDIYTKFLPLFPKGH